MPLFRVTVKRSANVGGVRIEKGMSVEIPTTGYNPLTLNGGNDVVMAFYVPLNKRYKTHHQGTVA